MGVAPSYDKEPSIISQDIKDYLSSNEEYKCITLCEDLVYTTDEIMDNNLTITGKKVIIDLNGYSWSVPSKALRITSSYARITNGTLSILEEDAGTVISIENGCKALIDNIRAIGEIEIKDSSVTLANVIINATIS